MTTQIQPPHLSSASFSLSSENIADIAARVVKELHLSNDPYSDDFYPNDAFHDPPTNDHQHDDDHDDGHDDDDDESEFEFAILNSSPISADEIFSNGQIKPMFPVFNTDLVYGYNQNDAFSTSTPPKTMRLPLRKLLQENGAVSSSSSDADDLEGVPPGTYCVWTPKKKEEVQQMRKKSKSTGLTSKRWRFRDLLHRSNSDGKDTFVFLTPTNKTTVSNGNGNGNGGGDGKRKVGNGNGNGGKKKSYLPYRQDLIGFFANVNGIRTVRPF